MIQSLPERLKQLAECDARNRRAFDAAFLTRARAIKLCAAHYKSQDMLVKVPPHQFEGRRVKAEGKLSFPADVFYRLFYKFNPDRASRSDYHPREADRYAALTS